MTFGLRIMFALLSGFLIGQAHFNFSLAVLIALAPMLIAIQAPNPDDDPIAPGQPITPKRAALLAFVAYATASSHQWGMNQYGWPVFGGAVIYLSAGFALLALMVWPLLRTGHRLVRVLGWTGAFVVMEYTRTLGSWSYPALMGANLSDTPILAQLASLAGPWGLGAFIMLLNACLAEAFEALWLKKHPWLPATKAAGWLTAAALVLGSVAGFGAARLAMAGPAGAVAWDPKNPAELPQNPVVVAITQGSIPTWLYRRAAVFARLQHAVDTNYLQLLDQSIAARPWGQPPDWIVMPEAAFGKMLVPGRTGLTKIPVLGQRQLPAGTTLVMGSTSELVLPDSDYPRANRENLALSIVTPPEGGLKILDKTRKGLMVPIAEARYRPADRWRPLKTLNHPLGVFICYESVYPRVGQALADADILAVITNDAGLRWSTTPTGHVRLGKLRAVESGRSLIHAGQAGISFMLDPYGRSTPQLELFERGVLLGAVSAKRVWTLYGVMGQWWVVIFAGLWLASLAKAWMEAKSQV